MRHLLVVLAVAIGLALGSVTPALAGGGGGISFGTPDTACERAGFDVHGTAYPGEGLDSIVVCTPGYTNYALFTCGGG